MLVGGPARGPRKLRNLLVSEGWLVTTAAFGREILHLRESVTVESRSMAALLRSSTTLSRFLALLAMKRSSR